MMSRILLYLSKHYKAICIITGVLLICMLLFPISKNLYNQRIKYKWNNYAIADTLSEEPFGDYYFNQYLDSLYGKRIMKRSVNDELLKRPCNYIIITQNVAGYEYDNETAKILLKFVHSACRGSNFIITGNDRYLPLYLGCVVSDTDYNYFDVEEIKNSIDRKISKVKLDLKTDIDSSLIEYPSVSLWENMISSTYLYIPEDAEKNKFYIDCYDGEPHGSSSSLVSLQSGGDIALRRNIGKGHITLVSCTYLFTNYGISFDDGRTAVRHILDRTIDSRLPVVVIYDNLEQTKEYNAESKGKSMFYVFLERPATALFIYLLLGTFILTFIFNSRRRQRAEKSVKVPYNSSITYIRHLVTLYKKSSDYKELLLLERRNLLYELRKEYRFDIDTDKFTQPSEFASRIAESKSLDENKVMGVLKGLDRLCNQESKVDAESYMYMMDSLQTIK